MALDSNAPPSLAAGCINVKCDHPEGPKCRADQVCDPGACSCVVDETGGFCSCEPGGDLGTGCRQLLCTDPAISCPDHFACDPENERANAIGCVPDRCDQDEVDCIELAGPESVCKPECGTGSGCVVLSEGTDECGRLPPGDPQY